MRVALWLVTAAIGYLTVLSTALPDVGDRFTQLRAQEELLDVAFFKGEFQTSVITPSVELLRAIDHFYDPIYNHTEERIAIACSKWPPKNYVQSIQAFIEGKGYQKAAFIHYYSSAALSSLEKRINIQLEELSIAEQLCANTSAKQFQSEKDHIQLLIAKQLADAAEQLFPESVALVVKQYLNQVSPKSFVGNARELKNYNQQTANEMLAYLSRFYDGLATFAIGLNRDHRPLIGITPNDSVIQVSHNGWTSFVYRTAPNVPAFAPFTDEPAFTEALSSIDEATICVDGNDVNRTAEIVFSIVQSICWDYKTLCAIGTFANTALAASKECVHFERAMICEHTDFRGFNMYFGMPIQEEPLEEARDEVETSANEEDKAVTVGKPVEIGTLPYNPGMSIFAPGVLPDENDIDEKGDEVKLLGTWDGEAMRANRAPGSDFCGFALLIFVFIVSRYV